MNFENKHAARIEVGQIVRLSCEGRDDEYGIVVSTWYNPEIDMKDCYVAFWGSEIPDFESCDPVKPQLLRYAAVSLQPVDDGLGLD